MYLNYPQTIPPIRSMEKLSSTKLVPVPQMVGEHCTVGLMKT